MHSKVRAERQTDVSDCD